ncbi:alpha,alpha-trehalose phosphate synthase subunit, putative [Talaromyces stipitatus ATCC 10500]|uniref:Alpha,alpha-trehalose phosphate synthase subunit, putative n=1 Tax=Talaromyces stipitatus (strain ATCC 10500 / CBS 375.48 / QM 6759 / NRRL 1006) TaxID=441959 RepID=B8MGW5_TALSN|nr:alpha,alpha-trehalose phosphate synthase subunit, putative [Talaromyces stipitatus ATCC 10500]EED16346.1 alpha,alpha-trehalose phosphate synthase subunit, putative [Talaromyces stipitatus ATCC 10500]
MTLYVASLFLPYTIDFEAAGVRLGQSDFDGSNPLPASEVEGRLAELHQETLPKVLSMTPGATTEHEKIFKPFYAPQSASDGPNGPAPTENPVESWGSSRKFNQPMSKAAKTPDSSILSRPGAVDGPVDHRKADDTDSEEPSSPRVLLSDVDWVVKSAVQGNGGLRNAIDAAAKAGIVDKKVWVGTLGMPTDSLQEHTRNNIASKLKEEFESLAVFVGDSEFEGHYFHFCRNVLYPAFHYQMQESPRHKEYDDHSWKQYVKLNETFAETIAAQWKPGDRIWIHDYHLMLLPRMLRDRLPNAEIGFFMHTAFPSSEIFRCLATRKTLLEGLLGANIIGLQTAEYVYHFVHTCSRILRLEVSADSVHLPDRLLPVKAIPMGIDLDLMNEQRHLPEVKEWVSKIRERYEGKHLIVARDRLDAAGGVKQKLLSYEKFLKRYPEWRDNVVLVQVASSSAPDLTDLETQISKIAMRINSKYSTLTHQPLVLLKQDISFAQFLALMSVAEIFMITSLREGMNLAGHDFIVCQDGALDASQKYGSLILSEFTGSASIWSGYELLVNPWDYVQCADAINRALTMPAEEKEKNWRFLADRMAKHTASMWCDTYLKALRQVYEMHSSRELHTISSLSLESVREKYNKSKSHVFILGDQAIFPSLKEKEEVAVSSNHEILSALAADPKNVVYITSSQTPKQLELSMGESPNIGLIAENGAFLREPGQSEWQQLLDESDTRDWRRGIQRVMEYFQERTEGTSLEERRFSLTFNYKAAVDKELAIRQAAELSDQINGSRGNVPIRAVLSDGAVTVEPTNVTKATTAELALERLSNNPDHDSPDFLFIAGNTRGSETLFRWANQLEREGRVENVISVTTGGTQAVSAAATVLYDNETLMNGLAGLISQ